MVLQSHEEGSVKANEGEVEVEVEQCSLGEGFKLKGK